MNFNINKTIAELEVKHKNNAYIRTVSMSSHNVAILWQFPDSIDLQ